MCGKKNLPLIKMALTIANLSNICFKVNSNGVDTVIADFPTSSIYFSSTGDAHFTIKPDLLYGNMLSGFSGTGLSKLPDIANNLTVNNVVLHYGSNIVTIPVTDSSYYSGKTMIIKISVVVDKNIALSNGDSSTGTYVISTKIHYVFSSSYNNSIVVNPTIAFVNSGVLLNNSINSAKIDL